MHINTRDCELERILLHMAGQLDTLIAQVAKNTQVAESAVTLINGIAQRIKDAGVDQGQLDALVSELQSEDDKLASAVTANTPVA